MHNPSTTATEADNHSITTDASCTEESIVKKALSTRLAQIIGSESVASFARRSGVGESLLRKYLKGAQPNAQNLVLLADAGGASVDWLATGRLPRTRAEVHLAFPESSSAATGNDEFLILTRYRQADPEQRAAIHALLEAIANPGGMAWYKLGEAIAKIANIFPRKR